MYVFQLFQWIILEEERLRAGYTGYSVANEGPSKNLAFANFSPTLDRKAEEKNAEHQTEESVNV